MPFLFRWIFAVWHVHAKWAGKSVSSFRRNYVIGLTQANTEHSVSKWNDLDGFKLYIFNQNIWGASILFFSLLLLLFNIFFIYWWWLYAFIWPVLFSLCYRPVFTFCLLGKAVSLHFLLFLCLCGTWPARGI